MYTGIHSFILRLIAVARKGWPKVATLSEVHCTLNTVINIDLFNHTFDITVQILCFTLPPICVK